MCLFLFGAMADFFSSLADLTGKMTGLGNQEEERDARRTPVRVSDSRGHFEMRKRQMAPDHDTFDFITHDTDGDSLPARRGPKKSQVERDDSQSDGLSLAALGLQHATTGVSGYAPFDEGTTDRPRVEAPASSASMDYDSFQQILASERAAALQREPQAAPAASTTAIPQGARGPKSRGPESFNSGVEVEDDAIPFSCSQMLTSRPPPPALFSPSAARPGTDPVPVHDFDYEMATTFPALDTDMPMSGSEGNLSNLAPSGSEGNLSKSESDGTLGSVEMQRSWLQKSEVTGSPDEEMKEKSVTRVHFSNGQASTGGATKGDNAAAANMRLSSAPELRKTATSTPLFNTATSTAAKIAEGAASAANAATNSTAAKIAEEAAGAASAAVDKISSRTGFFKPAGNGKHSKRAEPLLHLSRPNGPPAWGALRFPGQHQRSPSKWCTFAKDTPAKNLVPLLLNTWQLSPPDVIISITGSASGDLPELSDAQKAVRSSQHHHETPCSPGWY